ncbi:MAG: cytidylate kinase-like family protein [Peptococcaceae bacterium]|jgi:cytidylate kinase|nr:cytidylate kinase-like family protein [Peptococcaceae bacterium]
MNNPTVITIGRQFGSGGRLIGQRLSELLSIPFYDNKLISLAAEKSGFAQDVFAAADERPANSFLYSAAASAYPLGAQFINGFSLPINDQLFLLQSSLIREFAQAGACVIIGRCADYVLREHPHLLSVFIYAPIGDRISRAVKEYDMPREKIQETIEKIDRQRAAYHNYYADTHWGKAGSYRLSIDSSLLGAEKTAELLAEVARKML